MASRIELWPLQRLKPYAKNARAHSEAQVAQLTAERIRTRYVKGFPQRFWCKPDGRRNEALDCRVYAYAALHGLLSMGLNLNKRVQALPPIPASRPRASTFAAKASPTPSPRRRRMAIASNYL